MLKIRLRRVGGKKQPSYRIVVADSRSPRDGRFLENIGFYNPRTEPPTIEIKEERALHWLSEGAQPTDSVAAFLEKRGTLDRLARLHKGEDLQALLAEAAASQPEAASEELEETPDAAPAAKSETEKQAETADQVDSEPDYEEEEEGAPESAEGT
jgi:small subunit ribosomal protein S16